MGIARIASLSLIEWAAVVVLSTQQKEKLSASLFISLIAAVALALGREDLSVQGNTVSVFMRREQTTSKADLTCIKKIARKRLSKITISRSFITAKKHLLCCRWNE